MLVVDGQGIPLEEAIASALPVEVTLADEIAPKPKGNFLNGIYGMA